ncbi:hypothetical protein HPB52_025424 [Rhipicephalus sanguineus]|uniref:Uncharacterized protein n=1 Tax=Rhipicephalus sanguineus TaxID=34632 RepID=A0A9D4SM93_RHISA|nr:hypothetical protein HPB52_025424 [Rhipicephalus sanguineus]
MGDSTAVGPPGFSLAGGRSRQMDTLLKEASRIIGRSAAAKTNLSPSGVSSARRVRNTRRRASAGKPKRGPRVQARTEAREEPPINTSPGPASSDPAPSAPDQVVTLYFRSPQRAENSELTASPPRGTDSVTSEGGETSSGDYSGSDDAPSSTRGLEESPAHTSEGSETSASSHFTDDVTTDSSDTETEASVQVAEDPASATGPTGSTEPQTVTEHAIRSARARTTHPASSATRERASSAPPSISPRPVVDTAHAHSAPRHNDVIGEERARPPSLAGPPGEEERAATAGCTADVAQEGASPHSTAVVRALSPPSPHSSDVAPSAPETLSHPVTVACITPSSEQQRLPSPLSRPQEDAGASSATMSSATVRAALNSDPVAALPSRAALGPLRPPVVDAFTDVDYQRAANRQQFPAVSAPHESQTESSTTGAVSTNQRSTAPSRKKKGRRQHQLEFVRTQPQELTEPQGNTATVLYRPKGRKNNYLALTRDAIAAQLSRIPGAGRVRVNFRGNVVAVDSTPGADTAALLAVQRIGESGRDVADLSSAESAVATDIATRRAPVRRAAFAVEGIMLDRTARPPVLSAYIAMALTSQPSLAALAGSMKGRYWRPWPLLTRPFLAVRQRD